MGLSRTLAISECAGQLRSALQKSDIVICCVHWTRTTLGRSVYPTSCGKKPNPSYVVGGTLEDAEANQGLGYVMNTVGFIRDDRLMLIAEIRLFANNGTPTYHVVVGDVHGQERTAAVLQKVGPIELSDASQAPQATTISRGDHWMPSRWPLPFWTT